MHDESKKYDPYLDRILKDLEVAEANLKADIDNRSNPFRTDGEQRMKDAQANVDGLHELIRSYMAGSVRNE